ncbi:MULTISPECIES: ATP-binding cassette domain-containing protein [Dietzia]|uniref:ATP-binding cassette domain-containing protein n=1 Tax=Dietzia cinnamea TaxID=321318 RepID=A0AAW5QB59_9ACTN|nr:MULTISPECIES: ATP-binding cassette domain-containing protein [Dietzia]PWD94546.1 daunorubicin ABC transporter ATP-binding protein [Dietzia maris]MBM7229204.1 ATP-binding cassette domain-containing protein [Dietzia cinnamea]MCT1640053.1 ATP-binding cassette domain-containing protein [Dietzia cinnamea]MCT1862872.1 ATP-binding cassette domain-containing protein [Dietzia cinnamea]MCT1884805.1 ATP-binding cassette domain-containing protein [Dietzia cinnamea]
MSTRSTSAPAIEAEHLVKRFGDFTAVDDISFTVPTGTVLGLLGPNGSGKTTTIRMMTTLSPPTSGTARVAGHDVVSEPALVRKKMGLTAQSATVDELLTGRENLRLVGDLYGLPKKAVKARADELLEKFSLTEAATRVAKSYSGGMRRRLDLAASLVAAPPVLFLDEPTTGLDPRSRNELWDVLRGLVRDGTTLLLTTQYLDEADQLADRVIVIDHGRVIAEGTPLQLKDRSGVASLVITVSRPEDVDEAARVLTTRIADFHVDRDARRLTAPSEGVSALAGIAAAFTEAGIELDDIGLQRPSLDDVFLSLTGRKAEDPRLESGGDDTARSDTARSETASLGTTEEEYRV